MTMFPSRIFLFAVLAWAGSVSAAADYVFVFYEEGVTAEVYDADTLELAATPEVGADARQAIGVPDASDPTRFVKLYVVNDNAVRVLEPEHPFATIGSRTLPRAVNPGERPAMLTPDARWLLVPAGNILFVFDAQHPTDLRPRPIEYDQDEDDQDEDDQDEDDQDEDGQDEDGQDRNISSVTVEPNGDHAHVAIAGSTDVHSVRLQGDSPRRLAGPIVLKEAPDAVTIAPNGAGLYAASRTTLYDVDFDTGDVRGELRLDFDEELPRFFAPHGGTPLNRLILTYGNKIFMPTLATFTSEYGAFPRFDVDKILAPTQDRLFLLNRAEKQIFTHSIGERDFDALRDPRTQTALRPYAIDMAFDIGTRNLFILGEEDLLRFSADAGSFGTAVPLPNVPARFSILSTAGATPDAVEVYGGNRQEADSAGTLKRPLAVRVSDANGLPVFGAEVTFSSSDPNIGFTDLAVATNRFGIAETTVSVPTSETFSIRAQTANDREAVFEFNDGPVGKGALTVLSGDFQAGLEDNSLPRAIWVQVAGAGVAIPDAKLTITKSGDDDSLVCPPTTNTGAGGTAAFRCTAGEPLFSGFPSTTLIEVADDHGRSLATPITIHTIRDDDSETLLPAPGNPIKVTEGTIRGIAGETLENAVELRVRLRNGRAPRTAIAVEFDVEDDDIVPVPHIAPADSDGFIRADLKLGCRPGRGVFTASLSIPNLPGAEFDYEIVRGPMNAIDILQGDHQMGLLGERLSLALLARIVDSCDNPFENIPVTWEVVPPDAATLESQSLKSNRDGQISSLVRMGSRPGDFSVTVSTAGADGVSTTFRLSAFGRPPPMVSARGFVNGASFDPGWTPGSLGTIFGTNLMQGVDGVVVADAAPFPTRLRNVSVTVNGEAAPILSLANVNGREQINLQVPFDTPAPADDVVVTIENNGVSASFSEERIHVVQPGIFEYSLLDLPEDRFAAALHADYSLVQPTNPARPGEIISLFFTGGGPLDPPVATNAPGPAPLATTVHPASVTLGGVPQATSGEFLGSFYAPALYTVYQVNFRVGEDTPEGNLEIRIAQSGIRSQGSLLPVRR